MGVIQLVISVLLFLILFFGIGFLLNMLLKTTWLPGLIIYPVVVFTIVSDVPFGKYFSEPAQSFARFGERLGGLLFVDYVILTAGLLGAILSGVTIRILRARGYRMF